MDEGGEIPDASIASALEFAVGIAAAGSKLRPPLPFPSELRKFLKFSKLPPRALRDVRNAVEADDEFFSKLGLVATADLVDAAGMMWLKRPPGWRGQLLELCNAPADSELPTELRRSERRRQAAEQSAHRALAELAGVQTENIRIVAERSAAIAEGAQLRAERDALKDQVTAHKGELRSASDRTNTARARFETVKGELVAAEHRAAEAERVRDLVLAQVAAESIEPTIAPRASVLEAAADIAEALADQANRAREASIELARLAGRIEMLDERPAAATPAPGSRPVATGRPQRSNRRPVGLPGGIYGSTSAAAEYLVRQPRIAILVDGYNVAKLAWPQLDLESQREQCISAAEDVARRFGSRITVVFDGASVTGSASNTRRLVRVTFSEAGVIADDVLRAEVIHLADDVAVLVITNDQQVLADVRTRGANTMSSEQWLELARR